MYKDAGELVRCVEEAIIKRAERAAEEIAARREASERAPVSIARLDQGRARRID